MTYLELKREVEELQSTLTTEIKVVLISDMPLQPWFESFLKKAWAKAGKKADIQRIPWQLRSDRQIAEGQVIVVWPSPQVINEVDPDHEVSGIWIDPGVYADPITAFYGAVRLPKMEHEFPKGSLVLELDRMIHNNGADVFAAGKEARWGDIYSSSLQEEAANQVVRAYETRNGRRKKCIVLDCDGVLWGGIVSEDGLQGIALAESGKGKTYHEFQRLLKKLSGHGIILAICSKNEEADVKKVFRQHTAMVLKEEDIAAWSVNWEPKSNQIGDLAQRLRIDPKDMVFVDDQKWEIAEVQNLYPEIGGVCFDPVTSAKELARWIWLLPEDINSQNQLRLLTYQDDQKREELKQKTNNYEEFLKKLNTVIDIRPASASDLPRISDLSRRANQCTNGTRYTVEMLETLLQQGYQLYSVFMSDIYRDLGLVGCIGLKAEEGCLDLFCLSCRALGRRAEHQLLAAVPQEIFQLRWQDTGKNQWLKDWLKTRFEMEN